MSTRRDGIARGRGGVPSQKRKKKCEGREGGLAIAGSAGAEWLVQEICIDSGNNSTTPRKKGKKAEDHLGGRRHAARRIRTQ
jgi:hypothetical protein